jgi:hypothetical protein
VIPKLDKVPMGVDDRVRMLTVGVAFYAVTLVEGSAGEKRLATFLRHNNQ